MRGQDGFHLRARVRDAAVLHIRRHAIDDLDVGRVLEDRVGDDVTHLDGRERVEDEFHNAAFAANPIDHVGRGDRSHFVAVASDVGDKQGAHPGVHAEHRHTRLLRGLQTGGHLRGVRVENDRVDLLIDRVLQTADDAGDVALGVDDVDRPAVGFRDILERFHVVLGARLRHVWRDDGDFCGGKR